MADVTVTYLLWFALIVASFVVDIVGAFVVPFAIWRSDGVTLPAWASWWDNAEEPLGDVKRKAAIDAAAGLRRGWLRWCWLCIRNPGHNFGYLVGFMQSVDVKYVWSGDPGTSDQGRPGVLRVFAYRPADFFVDESLSAFCYYRIWRWSATRCLRVFIGWKIHDNTDEAQRAKNFGKPAQIVCVINPFMTFEARSESVREELTNG